MSAELALQKEWDKNIKASPEVKEAIVSLEFNKRKMNQLHEELSDLEVWEVELEKKLAKLKEQLQPPMMKFCKQLDTDEGVEITVVEASVHETSDPKILINALQQRVSSSGEYGRSRLLGLINTTLSTRNCLVNKDLNDEADLAHNMIKSLLKQLGRSTIDWKEMKSWEIIVIQKLLDELSEIPGFILHIIGQLLTKIKEVGRSNIAIQCSD